MLGHESVMRNRAAYVRLLKGQVSLAQREVCSHNIDDASQCRKGSFFPFLDDVILRCGGFCLDNGVNGGCSYHPACPMQREKMVDNHIVAYNIDRERDNLIIQQSCLP
jgi:hypothetical protein